MGHAGYISGGFTKALYNSHGFSALEEDRLNGREVSIGAFPCNANVLEASIGVITISEDVAELARNEAVVCHQRLRRAGYVGAETDLLAARQLRGLIVHRAGNVDAGLDDLPSAPASRQLGPAVLWLRWSSQRRAAVIAVYLFAARNR